MTDDQKMEHAVLVHQLEVYECDTCAVEPDPACELCGGHGEYYTMVTEPCGRADCPVGRRPH